MKKLLPRELIIVDEKLAFQNEEKENLGSIPPEYINVTISPIEDWKGNIISSSKIVRDITETKSAKEKLQRSLKEVSDYKYALNESSIVAITDQKGIIQYANDNFCRISKYSREELIGQDHRIVNSGFHPKEFIRELWQTIANGKIWKGELKNKAKDGTIYWVDTTIVPFLNEQGKPYQYIAIRADITGRKSVEENLVKSLKEVSDYKYALNESSIVAITDQKGIIQYANDNFCRISKYSREELIGQDHRIINSGFHPKEFIRELWQTIANGKIWKGELKNKAKDGTIYWVDTTIVPFLNVEGKPYQYVAIRADITMRKLAEEQIKILNEGLENRVNKRTDELSTANKELAFQHKEKEKRAAELIIANKELVFQNEEKEKRAAELLLANKDLKIADDKVRNLNNVLEQKIIQLESANKDLESFSYSVSHDLRTPLRAIHGYTKMLKEDYTTQLEPEANRLMNNIMLYSKKMGQLIDDLLTFSRLGRKELVKESISMHDMASDICSEIKNENNDRRIQFKIGDLHEANGDSVAIKQAWENLISNAVKYSRLNKKTVIEIGSEVKGDELIYYIKDNGVGFDMRYADNLFGVFRRLHNNKDFEGTGVGLAIVHRIISKHGGRVWAEGKLKEGAIFYFSLPKNTS